MRPRQTYYFYDALVITTINGFEDYPGFAKITFHVISNKFFYAFVAPEVLPHIRDFRNKNQCLGSNHSV